MEATCHLVKDSGLRVEAATGQNADKLAVTASSIFRQQGHTLAIVQEVCGSVVEGSPVVKVADEKDRPSMTAPERAETS